MRIYVQKDNEEELLIPQKETTDEKLEVGRTKTGNLMFGEYRLQMDYWGNDNSKNW